MACGVTGESESNDSLNENCNTRTCVNVVKCSRAVGKKKYIEVN